MRAASVQFYSRSLEPSAQGLEFIGEKIPQTEMISGFSFSQVRAPEHRRDHRYRMEEENDVKERCIGKPAMQADFAISPRCLIARPERESERHQRPETALLPGAGQSVAERDRGGYQHQRQSPQIGKCRQPSALMSDQRHAGKSQCDPGRCGKPTVALEQTHPSLFYVTEFVIPKAPGRPLVTLVIAVRSRSWGITVRVRAQTSPSLARLEPAPGRSGGVLIDRRTSRPRNPKMF